MQETYKMKQQIQDHLDKVILPFWESLKDDEYGGFSIQQPWIAGSGCRH